MPEVGDEIVAGDQVFEVETVRLEVISECYKVKTIEFHFKDNDLCQKLASQLKREGWE